MSQSAEQEERNEMTDEQIKHMVSRFLGWKLPENFTPDGGVSFKKMCNENTPFPSKNEPVGTNLLDASQAEEMVRYMVEGLRESAPASEPRGDVVEAMLDAAGGWKGPRVYSQMTAAYQVAREHVIAEALGEPTKEELTAAANFDRVALSDRYFRWHDMQQFARRILSNRSARLTQQPSLQEKIKSVLASVMIGEEYREAVAVEIIALVQAEGEKQ